MNYGLNPVLPAYPKAGDYWKSDKGSRDFTLYGVEGWSTVRGIQTIRTPAGKFKALLVESRLSQKGFPFGSGKRLSWFAPARDWSGSSSGTGTAASRGSNASADRRCARASSWVPP